MADLTTNRSGAFDTDHPPAQDLIDDCVHCGFCLPACPTYLLWGEEMDSPRGRIYLMRAGLEGAPLNDAMVGHFDSCLGCLSCVTACPSGVHYEQLIHATRAQVERRYRRSLAERAKRTLIFSVFPYPKRLRFVARLLRFYQKTGLRHFVRSTHLMALTPRFLQTMEAIAPTLRVPQPLPERSVAVGEARGTVGLLTGCVQGTFFPSVNEATIRVLNAEGFDVIAPETQGCCGALSSHVGREEEAKEFARNIIDCFENAGVSTVVINSAGCGSAMKDYSQLLSGDSRYAERAKQFARMTKDIAEFLDNITPIAPRHRLDVRVAYHDACHLGHAQRITRQPRQLLGTIPGITIVEVAEGEICCGSAGVYNILNPEPAAALGQRKAQHVEATAAGLLVAANPGCTMQISSALAERGTAMPTAHTVEVLDASIRGVSIEAFLAELSEP